MITYFNYYENKISWKFSYTEQIEFPDSSHYVVLFQAKNKESTSHSSANIYDDNRRL